MPFPDFIRQGGGGVKGHPGGHGRCSIPGPRTAPWPLDGRSASNVGEQTAVPGEVLWRQTSRSSRSAADTPTA